MWCLNVGKASSKDRFIPVFFNWRLPGLKISANTLTGDPSSLRVFSTDTPHRGPSSLLVISPANCQGLCSLLISEEILGILPPPCALSHLAKWDIPGLLEEGQKWDQGGLSWAWATSSLQPCLRNLCIDIFVGNDKWMVLWRKLENMDKTHRRK